VKEALRGMCLHAGYLLGLFFYPEDGGDMLLRNVDSLSTDYIELYPEERALHNHRCENLESHIAYLGQQQYKLSSFSRNNLSLTPQIIIDL
jgi:hypothetical protein